MRLLATCRPIVAVLLTTTAGLSTALLLNETPAIGAKAPPPKIALVVGESASPLERHAANELQTILQRLFRVDVSIGQQLDPEAAAVILIGRPETNEKLAAVVADNWPELTFQGLVLRRLKREQPTLVVSGGSDVATLWAAYEMGERCGVRYLHQRDVYPDQRAWPGLPEIDTVMEAQSADSLLETAKLNDLPFGPVSWSLDENKRFLQQIAKMKFNRVRLQFWPAQPFVHYSIRGMPKPKGAIYFGHHFGRLTGPIRQFVTRWPPTLRWPATTATWAPSRR